MGYTVRVWVGLSSGWVMFGLNDISGRFDLGRVWFGSGRVWVNQFLIKYNRHAKRSNFVKNFGSGMVRFGSIRISGPLSGEHISSVGSGMGPGRSVRVSGQFCQVYLRCSLDHTSSEHNTTLEYV